MTKQPFLIRALDHQGWYWVGTRLGNTNLQNYFTTVNFTRTIRFTFLPSCRETLQTLSFRPHHRRHLPPYTPSWPPRQQPQKSAAPLRPSLMPSTAAPRPFLAPSAQHPLISLILLLFRGCSLNRHRRNQPEVNIRMFSIVLPTFVGLGCLVDRAAFKAV